MSAPHIAVGKKWRTTFKDGACLIDDRYTGAQNFNRTLNNDAILYVLPDEQLLCADFDSEAFAVFTSHKQAFAVMTKCEYVN